jgi:hypothetical protein
VTDRADITPELRTFLKAGDPPDSIALELLLRLRQLAAGAPLRATTKGDTSIGMTIERALGIPPNPSMTPDFKGIELKSNRRNRPKTRSTLFAQVADWNISPLKSSAQIVDTYGYVRNEDTKLYCTLSTQVANSQGLKFELRENDTLLVEFDDKNQLDIAYWPIELLYRRLLSKHGETFWIKADTEMIAGEEYFSLKSVIHTRNPQPEKFLELLKSGMITMDHLIKRKGGISNAHEKGPLFKIKKQVLHELFPEPVDYLLID